jgi:DNA-binding beta-propeller fold protein YncE
LLSTTDTTVRRIAKINVGQEPVSVAITPNRKRAFVANARDGTVSELDLKMRTEVRKLNVGAEPTALALSPNATRLYVSNALSNNVMVFDVSGIQPGLIGNPIDLSAIGNSPGAIAITNDGDTDDTDETIFRGDLLRTASTRERRCG